MRFQPTPNPNAGKFIVGRELVPGDRPRSFFTHEEAAGDPLAEALMGIDGVESLFMVEDFVTVTKRPDTSWDDLVPRVERALRERL